MNYLLELNGFWNFRKLNQVSSKQADLFFAILDCANTCYWKPRFNIPNSTLESMCQMSRNELHKNRNALIQLGLISYTKGKKGTAGQYVITPLYDTNLNTNKDINKDTNPDTDRAAINSINLRNIHKQNETKTQTNNIDFAPYNRIIENFTTDSGLRDAITEFIKMRGVKNAKPTPKALDMILKSLKEFENDISKQIEVLNNSIKNNWTGIYPLKKVGENSGKSAKRIEKPAAIKFGEVL